MVRAAMASAQGSHMNIHIRAENPHAIDVAFHWIRERERIRIKKERGEQPPYTDDPILRDWRFCNVRREDDRVTRWIAANIRRPFSHHPALWFMLGIGRWINWPDTLAALIASETAWPSSPAFSCVALGEALQTRMDSGEKTFGGAYKIDAPKTKGQSKAAYVAEDVLAPLWDDSDRFARHFAQKPSLRETHYLIKNRYAHWGHFMTYQAVVDMRFTPLLRRAPDVRTWCAAGPGTMRGLNRLASRAVNRVLDQHVALRELTGLYERIELETGVSVDLSDVPNICCEVDKYLRVTNGEGTTRAKYVPGRGC